MKEDIGRLGGRDEKVGMSIKSRQRPAEETGIPGGWAKYMYLWERTVIWGDWGFAPTLH